MIDLKLTSVRMFPGHDGIGLSANLVYQGKKIATVFDAADGGVFKYTVLGNSAKERKENINLFSELKAEVDKLPEYEATLGDEKFMMKHDVDSFINEVVAKQEAERAKSKRNKKVKY